MKPLRVLAITVTIIVCGCDDPGGSQDDQPANHSLDSVAVESVATEYEIMMEASLTESTLTVLISTNFPDGTILSISAGRLYSTEGDTTAYYGDLVQEKLPVLNGEVQYSQVLDDNRWLLPQLDLISSLPNDFLPIVGVEDNITVDVIYTPKTQSDEINNILGADGEYVLGEQADNSWSFTTMKVEQTIEFPFDKDL